MQSDIGSFMVMYVAVEVAIVAGLAFSTLAWLQVPALVKPERYAVNPESPVPKVPFSVTTPELAL